jgi:hypothetical protein
MADTDPAAEDALTVRLVISGAGVTDASSALK